MVIVTTMPKEGINGLPLGALIRLLDATPQLPARFRHELPASATPNGVRRLIGDNPPCQFRPEA